MIFTPHSVPLIWQREIESIFHYHAYFPDHEIQRVVPTGHVFLLFELDDMTRHTYDPISLTPNADFQQAVALGTPTTSPIDLCPSQFRDAGGAVYSLGGASLYRAIDGSLE